MSFEADSDAFEVIRHNFSHSRGVIRRYSGNPTPEEMEAIQYLCSEWDYGYDPLPFDEKAAIDEVLATANALVAETTEQTAQEAATEKRQRYILCVCLLAMQSLKDDGIIEGGPDVNVGKMLEEMKRLELLGMEHATSEEMQSCARYIVSPEFANALSDDTTAEKVSSN